MQKKSLKDFDLDKFSTQLGAETDRACAVLGAALLDAKLEDLFKNRLSSYQNELLDHTGALGSFSTKIRLSCSLSWISEDARHDLSIIRDIRNKFAHDFDHNLSFNDASISDRCSNIKCIKELIRGTDHAGKNVTNISTELFQAMANVVKTPRMRYQVAVDFLSQYIDQIDKIPSNYAGPDLLEQCYSLGTRSGVKISATATVGQPVNGTEG
jgi:DNA-binding MltR family transcriptional regulator